MDADRFDALTRALTGAGILRRAVLKGLAGSALGALTMPLAPTSAGATHFGCRHVGKPCASSRQCCSSRCRGPKGHETCRAHHVDTCTAAKDSCLTAAPGCGGGHCYCTRTTGGATFCSVGAIECMACSTDATCAAALGVPGSACVIAHDGDCTCASTACVRPCTV
jgi:hypothetical protein